MKKALILLAIVATVWSCSDNKSSSNDQKTDSGAGTATGPGTASAPETSPATDISQNPDYKKGLALIGQSDCLTCHKVSEKVVGPAYQDVAARYAGKPGIEDSLANKVIHGGMGNWGQVPMTAHPQLSHEDAVAMVKYILLLKQP
ncbi:MAG TPA: c-type cytochrome [Flavisolibacter sp.]|nr:c-type cytochrome [Flavisolibacter sp.]